MLSDEEVEEGVNRQLQEDPVPGTPHYILTQMVDRMVTGENLPKMLREGMSDEKRIKYNQQFLKRGYAYLAIRGEFPQYPVMLARRELVMLEQALHLASMAFQFHTSPDGSHHEQLAAATLKATIDREQSLARINGRPSGFSDMPGLAALTAILSLARGDSDSDGDEEITPNE